MKDIKGFEGKYAITEDGRVWSYKNKIYLKPILDKDGYIQVNLYKDGKCNTKKVHRLVAEAYIPNPDNKPQINHMDENIANNNIDNLEWCDNTYNQNYGSHNKNMGMSKSIPVYCVELDTVYYGAYEAARQTGANQSVITKCCKGKGKTAGGYHWRYADELLAETGT